MTGLKHITLRPARDADAADIAALIARVFAEYDGCLFVPEEFPELAAPASYYAAKGGQLWVAEQDGEIIGSIALFPRSTPGVFELGKMYVAIHLRGAGVARDLLARAFDQARAQQAKEIILFSDARFARGHAFYEKNGFVRLPGVRLLHDLSRSLEFPFRLALPSEGVK